jgi:hypothetical protein
MLKNGPKQLKNITLIFMAIFLSTFAQGDKKTKQQDQIETLENRREQIKAWASLCEYGDHRGEFSAQFGKCGQGDLMLFGGISGFSGHFSEDFSWANARLDEQKNSQGQDGRWWRGPQKKDIEVENSFSRDQTFGLMLYFVIGLNKFENEKNIELKSIIYKKYQDQFSLWVDWIETVGNGRVCLKGDQRCELNGFLASQIYRIGDRYHIWTKKRQNYQFYKKVKFYYQVYGIDLLIGETLLTPIDYQMLLKMIVFIIESYLGDYPQDKLNQISWIIAKKDKEHLLYQYLYSGPTDRVIQRTFERCTAQRWPVAARTVEHLNADGDIQWKRRFESRDWEIENGHGCIFLINLLIADLKGNLNWLHPWARVNKTEISGSLQKEVIFH